MTSVSSYLKYLDTPSKIQLAEKLALEIQTSEESCQLLCDLLEYLEAKTKESISGKIIDFCSNNENDYRISYRLLSSLGEQNTELLYKSKSEELQSYLLVNKVNFLPEFKATFELREQREQEIVDISSVLNFLEFMFMKQDESSCTASANVYLGVLMLLGFNDESITSKASSILRWRISNIIQYYEDHLNLSDLWNNIIFPLENSEFKFHKLNSYTLWLRILTKKSSATKIGEDILSSTLYWECIQRGLNSPLHEHRKICLSILQVSLQSIDFSFKNDIMSWDVSQTNKYLKEWSRYVTLFEILAIDTSLHQSEAGSNDIIRLISPASLIDSSWGFCLISTGFSASMDSVRKFSLGLLLSIPSSNLYLIKNGVTILEKVFLPNAMLASHFHTRKIGCTNVNKCDYGERLRKFIYDIIHCEGKIETQKLKEIINGIMRAVCDVESFDPAKIYVLLGLLEGLQKENFALLKFNEDESSLLKLFEYNPEGGLFGKTLQTICLRILLHFELLTCRDFFNILDKFVQFNGCNIVKENMGLIVEYFQKNKVPSADFVKLLRSSSNSINDSTVVKSLTFAVFYSINPEEAKQSLILDLDNQNDILLISRILEQDIINVSLPINVEEYIIKLCNSELIRIENQVDEFKFFESISSVKASKWAEVLQDTTNWSFLTTLWGNVKEEVQSHDQFTLIIASKKLKLFTMLNETTQNNLTDLKTLLEFNGILFKNSRAISKQSTTFYKVREEALAQVYKLIKQSISTSTNRDIINSILEIIDCNSLSPELNYSVAELLSILLEFTNSSEIIQIISGKLYELWSTLNAARLFLNQKDLHCLIIRTFYHASIINESKKLEEISCTLLKFSIEVIENSNGRRCLLPTLTKLISDFQLTNSIDGTSWLPEVLVRSYIVQQLTSNIFKLENVVGKVFDECLAVDQTSRLYSEVYGLEEISARINIMAILGTNTNEKFSKDVVQFITENQEEFKLYEVIKKTDGFEEWRRIQLMSVILIASNNIPIDEFVEQYYNTFVKLLETDPSPLVRNYIEWIACKCLLGNGVESPKHIENTFRVLKQLVDMNGGKPTLLTSYERILCMMIQQLPKEQEEELLTRFLTIVIPAATSNKAVTRHFSLSLMCSIHPQIVKKNLNLDVNLIKVLENMYQTAITSESFGQHRSGDATLWNVVKDMTLVSISGGVLLRVSDRDIDFITKESYEQNLSIEQKKALLFPIGENFEDLWITDRILQGNKKTLKHNTTAGSSIETTPLQTKSGALNSIVNVDDNNTINVVRSDLIVCASLVDKPPNLGGICRLSDVLGAGLLTLHDLKVKEHQQFKTVAVTADRWMPMVEVKPDGIIPYLMEKKKEGYTLIGLEQTDKSVQLNSELQFPKKSLILIGREKEGIPGDLLAELDFCVEIKQVGVIRSMNIQTATAIIVHAYSTQHC